MDALESMYGSTQLESRELDPPKRRRHVRNESIVFEEGALENELSDVQQHTRNQSIVLEGDDSPFANYVTQKYEPNVTLFDFLSFLSAKKVGCPWDLSLSFL